MVAACARHRAIEEVPATLVVTLGALDALPTLPPQIADLGQRGVRRVATPEEVAAFRWLAAWEGRRIAGLAAFRDVFDPHTCADVREVVHLVGSRRAVTELVLFMDGEAAIDGLPLIGATDADNGPMNAALAKLGFVPERIVWAKGGER